MDTGVNAYIESIQPGSTAAIAIRVGCQACDEGGHQQSGIREQEDRGEIFKQVAGLQFEAALEQEGG